MFKGLEVGADVFRKEFVVPPGPRPDILAEHAQLGIDENMFGFIEPFLRVALELGGGEGRSGQVHGDVEASAKDNCEASSRILVGT